jgi:hypothetical protein
VTETDDAKTELRLKPRADRPPPPPPPVAGYCAVGFGLAAIIVNGPIFVPLGLIAAVVALFSGQLFWAIGGVLLAAIGILTSPVLLAALGLGAIAVWLGLAA